ncbi:MAG: radical SAM superfamily enzyme YgiQ (UPF0313 family) [Myxococcota bacterium]|jgi:radical SAM superfamily enzyme YgiQ (UPF0313 family)
MALAAGSGFVHHPSVPNPTPIVLATINAKYIHAAFGLRYLRANLGELRDQSVIVEFTNQLRVRDMVEQLLAYKPRIIGLGVYIWNAQLSESLVALVKQVAPEVTVVLGGPEVSYETDLQRITSLADVVVIGEGEDAFRTLCTTLLDGKPVPSKLIQGGLPDLATLQMPYDEYSDEDVANRIKYVEASRGCPFRCEFCLSSLDQTVRPFPLDRFLAAMQRLLDRGTRHFKFVDRTFNLKPAVSGEILDFFLARLTPDMLLHFEMIPDRLPAALRERITKFPPGSIQFEVGIQTFDPDAAARISRRQNMTRLEDNFRFLREETQVHVHADLIIGLPGETMESFALGFDRLHGMGPQEIQVGILKRLRGTPIARHTDEFGMRYNPEPPYEILCNTVIDFPTMQRLQRFAHVWDRLSNRGNLKATAPLLWSAPNASPFATALAFADWLHLEAGKTHAIALNRLARMLARYLIDVVGLPRDSVETALGDDYTRTGRNLPRNATSAGSQHRKPNRQQRHL